VADFSGKPDILAADGTLNLGNGNGSFTPGTPITGTPLAVADFNGDGIPDVLEQGTGTLLVLLGNGDGTFQPPISTNSGASLIAVAATDLNGDGKADVVGVFSNTLLVYLANGDGTFAPGVSYSLGTVQNPPTSILFGDFNGDQKVDVIVVGASEIVLLGNGDGTFQSTLHVTTAALATHWVVGDFNGDGKLDLAGADSGSDPVVTVFLQLGNGDGTFQAPTTVATGPFDIEGALQGAESTALAAADLNGDGKLDLVLTGDLIGVYLGNGNGTFSSSPIYYQPLSPGLPGTSIADFNLDGKLDIAADGEILLGNGNGTFQGPPTVLLSGAASVAVEGKFVTNGAPGVAAISANSSNSLSILSNDGTGNLSLAHTYSLPLSAFTIAVGDVNGDGNLDLVIAGYVPNSQNWSYCVLLGNGDGSFQAPVAYPQSAAGQNVSSIVIADFNNDKKPDLAIAVGNDQFAALLGNGNGTFGSPAYVFDGDGEQIVSADFNGDGNLDIAEAGTSGLAILLGNGNGTFQPATFPYTTSLASGLFAADLNNDGKVDLVGNAGGIQVFLGNGNGTFNALASFGSSQLGVFVDAVVALADVNSDGKIDVIAENHIASTSTNGIFLGNGDGTFDPSEIQIPYNYAPHTAPLLQAADMNGDGKPDLIIESPLDTVFVLINSTVSTPGTSLSPASLAFPSQTVGSSSNPTPVTLTNSGAVTLTVSSVTLSGTNAGEFTETNNCATVQPLTSCTINVTFTPTAAGAASANLIIADNAGSGSQLAALSGTGKAAPDFTIGMASGGSSSSTISAGQTATFGLALTPAGSFSGTVNLTCGLTPAVTPAPVCAVPASVSVTGGSAAPVTVTVATTAAGSADGVPSAILPPSTGLLAWALALSAWGFLLVGKRRRPLRSAAAIVLALIALAGCGSSSTLHSTGSKGTPAGTYTATITATSGSLSHQTTLTVIVQ
jgi:hypothetical protein